MNINVKILHKTNQFQKHIKGVTHHGWMKLSKEEKGSSTKENQSIHYFYRIREEIMILTQDAEKTCDKIQQPFMTKRRHKELLGIFFIW